MKQKIAKIVRVATLAPIIALIAATIMFVCKPEIFGDAATYILTLVFLTVLPLLAYPLQPVFPAFRDKGRSGQRTLAMIMAVVGYILGIIFALVWQLSQTLFMFFLTYLLSGLLLLLFNKGFKIKASGHAGGVSGPIVFLIYVFGPVALWGIPVLIAVYWASLCMKRHTPGELEFGSVIPPAAVLIAWLLLSL